MLRITTPCGDDELFERSDDVLVDFLRETLADNGFSKEEMYSIIDDVKNLPSNDQIEIHGIFGLVFKAEVTPEHDAVDKLQADRCAKAACDGCQFEKGEDCALNGLSREDANAVIAAPKGADSNG